jgi:hypothetical protein
MMTIHIHIYRPHGRPFILSTQQQHPHTQQEKEGVDYAEWLCREEGVAAYVLKYRLGPDGYVV